MAIAAAFEWNPRQIEELTLWEIAAYAEGLRRANGSSKPEPMSNDDFDALCAMHKVEPGHA